MQRFEKILSVCLIILSANNIYSQSSTVSLPFSTELAARDTTAPNLILATKNLRTSFNVLLKPYAPPANIYVSNFGYFCRQELNFEKKTALPIRFRLGSLKYTQKMEGYSTVSTTE